MQIREKTCDHRLCDDTRKPTADFLITILGQHFVIRIRNLCSQQLTEPDNTHNYARTDSRQKGGNASGNRGDPTEYDEAELTGKENRNFC